MGSPTIKVEVTTWVLGAPEEMSQGAGLQAGLRLWFETQPPVISAVAKAYFPCKSLFSPLVTVSSPRCSRFPRFPRFLSQNTWMGAELSTLCREMTN